MTDTVAPRLQAAPPTPLEAAIITPELERRPARPADFRAESEALGGLMRALREADSNVLQELAEAALRLCRAHSGGISIAEGSGPESVFRWHGAAGRWSAFIGQTMPRDPSPCGVVLARRSALLMAHPERHFAYPAAGMPPIAEALLVPFELAGQAVGTVWVIAHDETRKFDREDLRLLSSLSEVAAVAYQLREQASTKAALVKERAGYELLQGISAGLKRNTDFQALCEQIVDASMTIMGSDFASLQMLQPDSSELQLLAWRNFHPASARLWERIRADSGTSCARALQAGERTIVFDTETCASISGTETLTEYRRSGIRSVQSTPLVRAGELIGIISTHWRVPHQPSVDELVKFDVLARLAAELLDRAKIQHVLRETERRKDQFLAVLSHELRNPLSPLVTGIELLQSPGQDPQLVGRIHRMMSRQLAHLVRLVDDLLDLSRISRNKLELRKAPIELRVVTDAAVELSKPLLDQRRHELLVSHAEGPVTVNGDLERLTQIVANVLRNAARYTPPGGRIRLEYGTEDDRAVLRIRDTGLGIPADRLEAVFEMFSQIPGHDTAKEPGGLGVGLALSRQLAELHGGSIVAKSAGPGCGSEFIITLPGIVAGVPPEGAGPAEAPHARDGRRVLVVDDNTDAADALALGLESMGHTTQTVHDGAAALAALERFDPEIVLLDIGMPRMDGYEVARRIRSTRGAGPLLVAITGWGQESDRRRAREAGFDHHLSKPVTLPRLQSLLDDATRERPSG